MSRSSQPQVDVGNLPSTQLGQEVYRLLEYLNNLQPSGPAAIDDLRPVVRQELIRCFGSAARKYARLANEILECAATHDSHFPRQYYEGQVLRRIADHVRLLAQLFVDMVQTSPQQSQMPTLDAIQALIWAISRSVPDKPILIPMLSSQFVYVHLSYVEGVGIIGVPPYALVRPYPDLPILWHEVAGYWVALRKVSGDQKAAAVALRERAQEGLLRHAVAVGLLPKSV